MTISSTDRSISYQGTGTVATYAFAFKVFSTVDLVIYKKNLVATPYPTFVVLALTTDYTVSLNANQDSNPGGTITLVAGNLGTDFEIIIVSNVSNLQPTTLTNLGGFYPSVINDSLDRATIQIQQLQQTQNACIRTNPSDFANDMSLPGYDERIGKYLAFDIATGDPIALSGTGGSVVSGTGSATIIANQGGANTARDVIFYDNTVETMRIDGSGTNSKVGIGVATPAVKLQVHDAVNATGAIQLTTTDTGSGASNGLALGVASTVCSLWNYEATPLVFGTSGLERVQIKSNGDVSIGSTATAAFGQRFVDINNLASGGDCALRFISPGASSGSTTASLTKFQVGGLILNNADPDSAAYIEFKVSNNDPKVRINSGGDMVLLQPPRLSTGIVSAGANHTLAATTGYFIATAALTLTLPAAATYTGRAITVKTIAAGAVTSASGNVVPVGSSTPGTAILAATIGKWATLVSDGTNWVIMAAN
ncbi:hypothetical protein UFOVP824_15 [uncultured Caudovirales phage]|uniref:Uncharacterized protein n=1 Tax=uncultured Caudovirales phage TaxID=2100421 RepID=A0A6J5NZ75_9CAUD|nr:hypothetical protein UFOVP824_15 [uncultured Caudovirales phage]